MFNKDYDEYMEIVNIVLKCSASRLSRQLQVDSLKGHSRGPTLQDGKQVLLASRRAGKVEREVSTSKYCITLRTLPGSYRTHRRRQDGMQGTYRPHRKFCLYTPPELFFHPAPADIVSWTKLHEIEVQHTSRRLFTPDIPIQTNLEPIRIMAGKRKRTDAPADAGKSKKTKAGASKREREEPSALPEPLETPEDAAEEATTTPNKAAKKEKKDKKEKKSAKKSNIAKSEEATGDATEEKQTNGAADSTTDEAAAATKSQKNKKNKAEDGTVAAEGKKPKAARFIVFVGNLPYTANASTIRQHFATVKPNAVRCLNKDGQENTCRGFAFIEFTDPTNMRNCLDKMHHSTFNDGLSAARKINVELTYASLPHPYLVNM